MDKYPKNPPAKESPAPVGSKTSILGTAGIAILSSFETINDPLLPFLIITYCGPSFNIERPALYKLSIPASFLIFSS